MKTELIQIRVTPAEKAMLVKLAAAAGVTVSGYLVGMALGDRLGEILSTEVQRRLWDAERKRYDVE